MTDEELARWDDFEERSSILEFDAGYSRAEAERLARQMTQKQPDLAFELPRTIPSGKRRDSVGSQVPALRGERQ